MLIFLLSKQRPHLIKLYVTQIIINLIVLFPAPRTVGCEDIHAQNDDSVVNVKYKVFVPNTFESAECVCC